MKDKTKFRMAVALLLLSITIPFFGAFLIGFVYGQRTEHSRRHRFTELVLTNPSPDITLTNITIKSWHRTE
jgi:hypothetical protein